MTFLHAILIVTVGVAFAKRLNNKITLDADANESTQGVCAVPSVEPVCICNNGGLKGKQCSECKVKSNWGYGCDLDCNEACGEKGCDFVGNCVEKPPDRQNPRCKRNSRSAISGANVFNQHGNCAACERGWYGFDCTKKCSDVSPNFDETAEGECTRGGKGYKCKEGWYGEFCNQKCPGGCKTCAMRDNLVPVPGTQNSKEGVEYMQAGACTDQCTTDTWGSHCQDKCPANCKKSSIPSCDKTNGNCYKCGTNPNKKPNKPHQWWGDKCATECSAGCVNHQCLKRSGNCEKNVLPGYCGPEGDKHCPEGTVSKCNVKTCLPEACQAGKYPGFLEEGVGACLSCPDTCADTCAQDGTCKKCKDGFYGSQCEKECSPGCTGTCEKNSGKCESCKHGLTGATCEKLCHRSCGTCFQFDSWGGSGNDKNMCTTCPVDQPSFLNTKTNTCDCIDAASRTPEGFCRCDEPTEQFMEAYFVQVPKTCQKKCENEYRIVYGDSLYQCITGKFYKSVVRAEALEKPLVQGSCAEGEYSFPASGEGDQCLRKAFVEYILQE